MKRGKGEERRRRGKGRNMKERKEEGGRVSKETGDEKE